MVQDIHRDVEKNAIVAAMHAGAEVFLLQTGEILILPPSHDSWCKVNSNLRLVDQLHSYPFRNAAVHAARYLPGCHCFYLCQFTISLAHLNLTYHPKAAQGTHVLPLISSIIL